MSTYHNAVPFYHEHIAAKKQEIKENYNSNFAAIYSMFYSIANSAFDWRNLPETILPHMPEDNLIYWGQLAFFLDDDGKPLIYPCYQCGTLLENGLYSNYYMIAKNGKTWTRKLEDIEICFNNSFRIPGVFFLSEFAEKSGFALSAMDATLQKAIMPDIIATDTEEQKSAVSQMLNKQTMLEPFLVTSSEGFKNNEVKRVAMFDIRERSVLEMWNVWTNYKKIYSNLYGIYNIENEKSERLTKGESQSSEDTVRYSMMADMWRERNFFQKRVKEHFGFDLQITPNRSVPIDKETIQEYQEAELGINENGGEDNGNPVQE